MMRAVFLPVRPPEGKGRHSPRCRPFSLPARCGRMRAWAERPPVEGVTVGSAGATAPGEVRAMAVAEEPGRRGEADEGAAIEARLLALGYGPERIAVAHGADR